MPSNPCPVCEEIAEYDPVSQNTFSKDYRCVRCGLFRIDYDSTTQIHNWTKIQRANLSGWIRENPRCNIFSQNLQQLLSDLRNFTVGEKADKLLGYMAQRHPQPGYEIILTVSDFLELQAASWSLDRSELNFLLREYLVKEKKFLMNSGKYIVAPENIFKISPAGWACIDSKRQALPNSQIGFIAMWFDKSVDSTHVAIDLGIRNSGYEPLRIDRKEHNNKIDDEIVAGIRRSKFLVADFTGHRGGVYFEAGLAMGLGLPVIWLCRKDDLEKTHFDTRQYNFIVWDPNELALLPKALQSRIEATIGRDL